jgi:putative oxidoreductase
VTTYLGPYAPHIYGITRFVVGMMYWMHGTQKLFAWPIGVEGVEGATRPLFSLLGAAGVIETIGGFMIMTGLYASWAGFVCSGQMAFAFFIRQFPIAFLPIYSQPGVLGESSAFNCFFFLYVAAVGSGRFSLDSLFGIGDCRKGPATRVQTPNPKLQIPN